MARPEAAFSCRQNPGAVSAGEQPTGLCDGDAAFSERTASVCEQVPRAATGP